MNRKLLAAVILVFAAAAGNAQSIAPSHSVATTTGMTIASDLAITSGSIGIDYACKP